jgi:hypothetical protein
MKVYKTKASARLARKERLDDSEICEAVERAEEGLIYAELGRFLIKQRVESSRVIMFHRSDRNILLHVFAKGDKENLSDTELETYREMAKQLALVTDRQCALLVEQGKWIEIDYERYKKEVSKRSASVGTPRGGGPLRGRRDR